MIINSLRDNNASLVQKLSEKHLTLFIVMCYDQSELDILFLA